MITEVGSCAFSLFLFLRIVAVVGGKVVVVLGVDVVVTLVAPFPKFVELMFANHFVPLINKPTRVKETSATLIDNIFTNNVGADSIQGIFYTDISDHFPIFYGCSSLCIDASPQYVTKRVYSDKNVNKFIGLLQSADWTNVCESNDPQAAYSYFYKEFQDCYLKSFPMLRFKINYRFQLS